MGTVKRPYGPWSRAMFSLLSEKGALKVEAFIAWLAEREIHVDRTLVSHWRAGRSHLPADLLPLLAQFTEKPNLVFGEYLREVGCEIFKVPKGSTEDHDLVNLILEAGSSLGRLQRALFEARMPNSPGGVAITDDEREDLRVCLDELIQRLADLRSKLKPL